MRYLYWVNRFIGGYLYIQIIRIPNNDGVTIPLYIFWPWHILVCTYVRVYIYIYVYVHIRQFKKKLSKMGRLISVFENSIFHDDDIIRAVPSAVPSPAPMSLIRGPWSELAAWQQFVNLSKVGRYISTVNWVLLCIRSMHTVYVYRYIEWYWQIIQISSDLLYIYT
jgi:hypothetical protein